jgi:hypothetical protein
MLSCKFLARVCPYFAAASLLSGVGCAEGTSEPGGGSTGAPAFAFMSALTVDDVASSYLVFLDSLEAGRISLRGAREFSGFVTMVARDGHLFIAEEEAPVIARYEVKDRDLDNEARVSFADYGLMSAGYGLNFYATATRAYVSVDAKERVIWNPSDMEIVGRLELDIPDAPQDFELNASYDRGLLLRDGEVFHSIYNANWAEQLFAAESHIVVWNAETDEQTALSTAPCPMLDAATQDDDGNIYYSTWSLYVAASYQNPDQSPPACAVRIPAGSNRIDESWTRDLADYTDGRPVINLQYAGDGKFLGSVFHEEHASKPIDTEQVYGANWRVWLFDLAAETAAPLEDSDWNDGGFSLFRFDGKTYVVVTTMDSAESIGYQLSGDKLKEVFRVSGAGYQIGKL